MAHSDRLERQQVRQIVREAEGYLDLIMSLADHWPLQADVRVGGRNTSGGCEQGVSG